MSKFNPQPKKGMPPKKARKPLKRSPIKRRVVKKEFRTRSKRDNSQLIAKLDSVISKIVRQKRVVSSGYSYCFTCPSFQHWTELDCGHFIPREHMSTRFDAEMNCQPQCRYCNRELHGNLEVFEKNLRAKFGDEAIDELKRKKYSFTKWSTTELIEMIRKYEQ